VLAENIDFSENNGQVIDFEDYQVNVTVEKL
jgi:hypothetical protein